MADEPTPAPVEGIATGMGFGDAPAPHIDPTFVNSGALTLLAQNVPPIEWTFSADDKAYLGVAPYGKFSLKRQSLSKTPGRLYCDFVSTCGTHTSTMYLDQDTIAQAKAAILMRLLDSLNQSRRLNLVIPAPSLTPAPIVEEPDLLA